MKTRGLSRRPRADIVHADAHVLPRESPRIRHARGQSEPVRCEECGAMYLRKTWRAGARSRHLALTAATRSVCPACRQLATSEYFGRLRVLRPLDPPVETEVRRRIANVEARARFTQPERRTLRVDRFGRRLEVLTTSQKLAHRIANELKKAFGGRVRYVWTDREDSLDASWMPPPSLQPGASPRGRRRSAR